MMWLQCKDWHRWQSVRRDRGKPPWIKIYRALTGDVNWLRLTDAQRGQLVSLWLLAGDTDGLIPADPAECRKLACLDEPPNLDLFVSFGWFVPLTSTTHYAADGCAVADDATSDGCQEDVTMASGCQPNGAHPSRERARARLYPLPSDPLISDTVGGGSPSRAREARPGRGVNNPRDCSDLAMIAPTEKQLVMLHDKAGEAGTTLDAAACHLGVPVAGINVGRIKAHLEGIIAERRARASPKTFAQARNDATDQALADVLRRRAGCLTNEPESSLSLCATPRRSGGSN